MNTDPPYNVKVEPRSNNAIAAGLSSFEAAPGAGTDKKLRPKDRPLANDFVSDDEFDKLLAAWFGNVARVLQPGRSFYIWGGYSNCGNYPRALKAAGLFLAGHYLEQRASGPDEKGLHGRARMVFLRLARGRRA